MQLYCLRCHLFDLTDLRSIRRTCMKSQLLLGFLVVFAIEGCNRTTAPQKHEDASLPIQTTTNASPTNKHDVVKLTPDAAAKVRDFQKQANKRFLRVSVKGGGTTGYTYDMGMENTQTDDDFVGESNGIEILIDKRSSIYLDGATIDWQTTPEGDTGFKFDNPNAMNQ